MNITILTLFPEMFAPLQLSVLGRGLEKGLWHLTLINIRDFATDKHNTVDDSPYGGGAGMVMKPDVVAAAIRAAKAQNPRAPVVYMAAGGVPFTQAAARGLASKAGLILLCGHYEGIDQRVLDSLVDAEISIGDYVLSGGELPAMAVVDAVVRLLPGVLGNEASVAEESFDITDETGAPLVEYPHYTRPDVWEGQPVPDVLKSGNHAQIRQWRLEQAKARTLTRTRTRKNPLPTPSK